METLAQAAATGWGAGAGAFLVLAAASAFAFRGPMRGLAPAAAVGIAVVFGAVALLVATAVPRSETELQARTASPPAASAGGPAVADERGLALIAEAERLLNRGDQTAAAETLDSALNLFRGQRNLAGQGAVYLGLGRMEHVTGQGDAARANFDRALEIYRRAGSTADVARVLMARGDLEQDTFQWEAAADYYRQGRQAWAAVPEPKSHPHVLLQLENVASMPDGEVAAWAVLDEATLIYENIGDETAIGDIALASAEIFWTTGNTLAAREKYVLAADHFRGVGNNAGAGSAASRAAEIDVRGGYNIAASALLDRAAAAFAEASDPSGRARVLAGRGDLARLVGDLAAAGARYREAAEALGALAHPAEADAWLKLGQVQAASNNGADAGLALTEALSLYTGTARTQGEIAARLALGRLAAASGDSIAARGHWTAALELASDTGEFLDEGRALLGLAGLAARAGETGAARDAVADAEARFRAAQVPVGLVLAALERSEIARLAGENQAAAAGIARAAAGEFAALDQPVAEANRFLGLPPVDRIGLSPGKLPDTYNDGEGLVAADAAAYAAEREANWAQHPDENFEARKLVAEIEARLTSALSAAN